MITTAYGGNTDFCADGHVWGEPDLDHAAEVMQQVAARRLTLAKHGEAVVGVFVGDGVRPPQTIETTRKHRRLALGTGVLLLGGLAAGRVVPGGES